MRITLEPAAQPGPPGTNPNDGIKDALESASFIFEMITSAQNKQQSKDVFLEGVQRILFDITEMMATVELFLYRHNQKTGEHYLELHRRGEGGLNIKPIIPLTQEFKSGLYDANKIKKSIVKKLKSTLALAPGQGQAITSLMLADQDFKNFFGAVVIFSEVSLEESYSEMIHPLSRIAYSFYSAWKYHEHTRRMEEISAQYIDRSLLRQLMQEQEKEKGQDVRRRDIVILLTDIKQFTTLSKSQPETVFEKLNEYYGEIVRIVEEHGGIIDKFIGDAVLVLFGALEEDDEKQLPRSCLQAARCGLAMIQRAENFNRVNHKEFAKIGYEFKIRVGINCGRVAIGKVGGNNRYDYTAIGQPVNITQRLEAANKNLNTSLLVSKSVYHELIKNRDLEFNMRPIIDQELSGIEEKIGFYEINRGDPSFYERYQEAFKDYEEHRYRDCITKLMEIHHKIREDKPSKDLIEACTRKIFEIS